MGHRGPGDVDDAPPDLSAEREALEECAAAWGLELGAPFAMSHVSYVVATTGGTVLKSASLSDDESLHEADALELWQGRGAVRLVRREGRVLLEERLMPGDDLSGVAEEQAFEIATRLAQELWRPATPPFRPVGPEVSRWLDDAERRGLALASLGRELFERIGGGADWVVHGDLHHHNILRSGERYVAIDPKPYLADREYDVASFLWNPLGYRPDPTLTERRIQAFVATGLDEYRIRAWTVIRGAYLRPGSEHVRWLRSLLD